MDGNPSAAIDALNRRYLETYPQEAARRLEEMDEATAAAALAAVPPAVAAGVLARLAPEVAADLLGAVATEAGVAIAGEMHSHVAARALGQMDEAARERLFAAAPDALAKEWRAMLQHAPDSAGRVMDVRYISFREGTTAGQALARIRRFESRAGVTYFLIDKEDRLRARVGLKAIALADPEEVLDGLARPIASFVRAEDPRGEVAEAMRERNVLEMPVVDNDGRLMGVIHYDALVDAIRDEATVDIQTMFGASKDERALSPALFSVRKRLPWMEINLVTAFLAAAVVGAFESTIAKYTALAVLLPVVAGQSGNAGAQALAVTIRGLALREFRTAQWLRVAFKELNVGLVNGVAIALTTGIVVLIWSGSLGLAGVIFLSMIISMVIAGVSGAMVPIVLSRLGQDPAQSSSIVLTTITDIFGFMSFLGIATILASTLPT